MGMRTVVCHAHANSIYDFKPMRLTTLRFGSTALRSLKTIAGWARINRILPSLLFFCALWMFAYGSPLWAQEHEVSGQVVAQEGGALPGVNVLVEGTTIGTTTDVNGSYSLTVPSPQDTLVFSFVGYSTEEIPINGRSEVDVTMVSDAEMLDEIVVVGYGEQQRENVTAAISQLSSQELEDVQATSVGQSLQGLASGVQVTSAGAPGEGAIVRIRGLSTTNNNQPLYVIDGVPVGGIEGLNPNDIQSIEVLKDASAASIYGSRAANGVVLISTKTGQEGGVRVNFSSSVGMQSVPESNWIDVMNTEQYVDFNQRLAQNSGESPPSNIVDSPPSQTVNWQDAVFRQGLVMNHNLGISGGSDIAQYRISGGYMREEGAVVATGFERYSLRINSNVDLGRFNVSESFSVTHRIQNPMRTNEVLGLAQRFPPYLSVRDSENIGGFNGPNSADGFDDPSPVRIQELGYEETGVTKIVGNVTGEARIVEGLRVETVLGADVEYSTFDDFVPSFRTGSFNSQDFASVTENRARVFSPISTTTLNFDQTYGSHNLSAIAGYELSVTKFSDLGGQGRNPLTDDVQVPGAIQEDVVNGTEGTDVLKSVFGRVTYNYDGRYLIQGALRRDGYSRFGPNYKYGLFPSGSVGWVLSEEAFLSDVSVLSNLKLRGSYGVTGNNQSLDRYEYQSTVTTGFQYPFPGGSAAGASVVSLANSALRWETTTMLNVGVDAGFFGQALTFTGEYYQNTTENILLQISLPPSFGYAGDPRANTGEVQATGFEFSAGYQSQGSGEFDWSVNANFSTASNEVTSLGLGNPLSGATWQQAEGTSTRITEGQPIWYFYGWEVDRLFQQGDFNPDGTLKSQFANQVTGGNPQPGDIKFVDQNGDGVINSSDRTNIGSPHPDYYFGLSGNFSWKNFDLALSLQGAGGHQILRDYAYWTEGMTRINNHSTKLLDAWTPQNTDTNIPRVVNGAADANNNNRMSDRWISDADYLRLQRVTLGYELPLDQMNLGQVRRARIYVQAENLFTFTGYPGYDPEVSARDSEAGDASVGIDTGQYVQPRAFRVGVNLDF